MTAPTLPTTPAPAPAPAAPTSFDPTTATNEQLLARYGSPIVEGAIEGLPDAAPAPETPATETAPATVPDAEIVFDEAVGRHRDAQGRFVKPDGSPDVQPGDAPDAEAPAPEAKDAKPKPFTIKDAEGELDVPEGVTVTFKLGGKEKVATLPELVRMAQSGGYQAGLKEEVEQARAERTTFAQREQAFQQQYAQLQQAIQAAQQREAEIDQQIAAFFADPARYEAARAQYAAANSPEARAERAEQELRAWQQRQHQQATAQAAQQGVETLIAPKVQAALTQYGTTVTYEEVLGKFAMLTDPLKVQGVLPPHRLPEAAAILDRELLPWAQRLHEQRTSSTRDAASAKAAAERAAAEQVAAAKAQAAQQVADAKRAFARRVAPAGAAAADTPPPPPPAKTAEDRLEQILARAASQLRAG
jgi:hypothetical protein